MLVCFMEQDLKFESFENLDLNHTLMIRPSGGGRRGKHKNDYVLHEYFYTTNFQSC